MQKEAYGFALLLSLMQKEFHANNNLKQVPFTEAMLQTKSKMPLSPYHFQSSLGL